MPNTRSKTKRAPPSPDIPSPDIPRSPPHKRARRLPPPPPIRTVCCHGEGGECTCGSDYRPRDPTCYSSGRAPASNSISEAFLLQNLGITESELSYMICLSMALKDTLVEISTEHDGHVEHKHKEQQWRVVGQGGPIPWFGLAVKSLLAHHVLSSDRGEPEPECQEDPELEPGVSQYMTVDHAIINIQMGQVDLKTVLGRAWVCQVIVPAVMSLLQNPGHHSGLQAKIMRGKDNEVRAYLVYQVVKAGLGHVSMRRMEAWRRTLEARGVESMTQRIERLEMAKNEGENTRAMELLEDRDYVDSATFARLESKQATDHAQVSADIQLLHTDLQSTRQLLTSDQIETRAWMREAVDGIRLSVSTNINISPLAPVVSPQPPSLFLRVRNHSHMPNIDIFTRAWTAGESTFAVARGLLRPFYTPFLIAIMGYSNAGKSYTMLGEDGVIAAVLGRLGPLDGGIDIKVYEVLNSTQAIGDFAYPDHTISYILAGIARARTTATTPANESSSRAHILVTFESDTGMLGCVIDIAGAEESVNRDLLEAEMKRTSSTIALDNGEIRKLLTELGTVGKQGFVGRRGQTGGGQKVSEVKRTSVLNLEISKFLGSCKGEPGIKVLLCVDGSRPDLFARAMTLIPEFPEVEMEVDSGIGGTA